MIPHEENPDSIKFYVKNFIKNNNELFHKKKVLDLPAGSGITSRILREAGATPHPYDLFPEFFHETDDACRFCDISKGIPVKDSTFDIIICQEGIEHFSDQFQAFTEFNRVLKKNGLLILTTPNYSSLQSRLSFLFFESENSKRLMPPNEYESIWFSEKKGKTPQYYFGHVFLLNIQKLRLLWKISGFSLEQLVGNRMKPRNLLLMILFPFIYWSSRKVLKKNLRKNSSIDVRAAYKEQFKLNISKKVLLHSHLFVVLKKTDSVEGTYKKYKNKNSKLQVET